MKRTPLKRRTRVKPSNPKRKGKAFARAYGSEARVAWVKNLPCLVCAATPSQNAHVRSGGTGRKADARWIVPLCDTHHHELHTKGINTFEVKYLLDLDIWAMLIDIQWQRQPEANV